jgi:hypothetical protein
MSNTNNAAKANLQAIKDRLNKAKEVVISPEGRLYEPTDAKVADKSINEKVTLKPQRWF